MPGNMLLLTFFKPDREMFECDRYIPIQWQGEECPHKRGWLFEKFALKDCHLEHGETINTKPFLEKMVKKHL